MKLKDGKFYFKQFSVSHHLSSMKVGIDGVLIGAWADCSGKRILDVGTGCGLIALMIAQRNPTAEITAIDIDSKSVEEASENFENSPWRERLKAREISFSDFIEREDCGRFDLVVSNPPYFDSGIKILDDARKKARHQGILSPAVLLRNTERILTEGGRLSMVVPTEIADKLLPDPSGNLKIKRRIRIRDHEGSPYKRTLLEYFKCRDETLEIGAEKDGTVDDMTMFSTEKTPTDEYGALCRDFYLYF